MKTDTVWLAGLLEGEGCFRFRHTPQIILAMTDEDVVARVANMFESPYWEIKARPHQNKPVFNTSVCGKRAEAWMTAILPWMGLRRSAKIMEVLTAAKNRPGVAKGERAGPSKLTDLQASEIKRLYIKGSKIPGKRSSDLAARFGITQSALWYVVNRRKAA